MVVECNSILFFFFFLFHFLASGLPCSFIIMHQNRYQQCIGVFILQAPTESVKVRGRTACWCNYTLCHLWSAPPDSSPMPPFSSRSNYSVLNVTSTNTLHTRKGLLNARHWFALLSGCALCVCLCAAESVAVWDRGGGRRPAEAGLSAASAKELFSLRWVFSDLTRSDHTQNLTSRGGGPRQYCSLITSHDWD